MIDKEKVLGECLRLFTIIGDIELNNDAVLKFGRKVFVIKRTK
jgi:hypothetical protein